MTRKNRLAAAVIALVVLASVFVLLRPQDSPKPSESRPVPVVALPSADPVTSATPPKPKIDPGPLLTGTAVKTIKVKKGDQVRFRVRSSVAEELHVHGYDLSRPLKPGVTVPVSFKATIDGIFELEFEQSGTPIASLEVQP